MRGLKKNGEWEDFKWNGERLCGGRRTDRQGVASKRRGGKNVQNKMWEASAGKKPPLARLPFFNLFSCNFSLSSFIIFFSATISTLSATTARWALCGSCVSLSVKIRITYSAKKLELFSAWLARKLSRKRWQLDLYC